MRLSEALRERHEPLWERIFSHPFVGELASGTLPAAKFRYYLSQDYVFLVEYSRVFGLAVAKAPDLPTMGRLAELLHSTLDVEMDLHRKYAARFGLRAEDLASTAASPTTHAYTRHLLAVAYSGTLAEIAFSLLPCQWGYWEIGQRLVAQGAPHGQPLYEEWVRTYSSPEYGGLAIWLRDLADSLAEGLPERWRARLGEHYLAGVRHERAFWDASYAGETWPL